MNAGEVAGGRLIFQPPVCLSWLVELEGGVPLTFLLNFSLGVGLPFYRLRVAGTRSYIREVAPNQGSFSGLLSPLIYSVKVIK
jgi:hypothetical protein